MTIYVPLHGIKNSEDVKKVKDLEMKRVASIIQGSPIWILKIRESFLTELGGRGHYTRTVREVFTAAFKDGAWKPGTATAGGGKEMDSSPAPPERKAAELAMQGFQLSGTCFRLTIEKVT